MLAAHNRGRREMRADVEPAGERGPATERSRLAYEVSKDCLCDVFSEMGIVADTAQRHRVDEPKVTLHELCECVFGPFLNVAAE